MTARTFVDPEPGGNIGPWRIVRHIKRGGFGDVWEVAWDRGHGSVPAGAAERAAAKVPRRWGADQDAAIVTEAERLRDLRHPGVVTVYGVVTDEDTGVTALLMELADHHLGEVLPLSADDALAVASDLADALEHLHAHDMVHNDLKPDNVLRCGDRWKLSDVGIAVELGAETHLYTEQVNIDLWPPEAELDANSHGSPAVRRAWDVWAFGLLLHQMATTEDPRPGSSAPARFASSLTGRMAIDPAIDPRLRGVIEQCLAAIGTRLKDGAEVNEALRKARTPPPPVVELGSIQAASPQELASAVVERWPETTILLAQEEMRQGLVASVEQVWGAPLAESLADWARADLHGDRLVAELVATLQPTRTPVFAGHVIGDQQLHELTQLVRRGDRPAIAIVDRLHESSALVALGGHAGHEPLGRLGRAWAEEVTAYATAHRGKPVSSVARATILQALLDGDDRARLVARARRSAGDGPHEPWVSECLPVLDERPGLALAVAELSPARIDRPPQTRGVRRRRAGVVLRAAAAVIVNTVGFGLWWWACFVPLAFVTQIWAGSDLSEGQGGGFGELIGWVNIFGVIAVALVGVADIVAVARGDEPLADESVLWSAGFFFSLGVIAAIVLFTTQGGPKEGSWWIGPSAACLGVMVGLVRNLLRPVRRRGAR